MKDSRKFRQSVKVSSDVVSIHEDFRRERYTKERRCLPVLTVRVSNQRAIPCRFLLQVINHSERITVDRQGLPLLLRY